MQIRHAYYLDYTPILAFMKIGKKHTNVGPYPFQMSRRNPGSHHDSKHIVRESSSIDTAAMKSNQYTQEIALGSAICLRCISNWKLVEIHGISYVHYISIYVYTYRSNKLENVQTQNPSLKFLPYVKLPTCFPSCHVTSKL